jgi:hypothetical protein
MHNKNVLYPKQTGRCSEFLHFISVDCILCLTVIANIKSHSFEDCSAQTASLFELDVQAFAFFCQFRSNWQKGSMLQFIINGGVWVDAVVKV